MAESQTVTAYVEAQLHRFHTRYEPEPNSGCWLWTGALQPRRHGSYGVFQPYGRPGTGNAHTFAYRAFKGTLPVGTEIDHLCRNPQCVNPVHLEAVVRRVNLMRGQTLAAINVAKTHCPKGHPYEGHNVRVVINHKGYRMRHCRTCRAAQARERYRRQRGGGQNVRSYVRSSTHFPLSESSRGETSLG